MELACELFIRVCKYNEHPRFKTDFNFGFYHGNLNNYFPDGSEIFPSIFNPKANFMKMQRIYYPSLLCPYRLHLKFLLP